MAYSMPQDDDFENNNPFSEPVEHAGDFTGDSEHDDDAIEAQQNEDQEQQYAQIQSGESEQGQTDRTLEDQDGEESGRVKEEELRKLLPERFIDKYSMQIKLVAIERNKPRNPILKFDCTVKGLPRFRQTHYKDVRRTFNEVAKFNKYLTVSNLEVFVPVIPSPHTSFSANGEYETKTVLMIWQEWFDRIMSNPILIRDEEFVYFIENDFGYSVINSNRKTSIASGLVRKTLKQLSAPYDPYEELAEFRPLVKASYLSSQKLHKALEKYSKSEKQLSIHIFDLSNKLIDLSVFETVHPGMKNMWEKLAKTTQIQSDLLSVQSKNDMIILGDGIQALVDDFYQVKEALTNRHLIMRELVQAENQTKLKHSHAAKIKNKSALDPIKVDEALRSLEYAARAENSLRLQVKRISGEMIYEKDEAISFTEMKFQKLFKNFSLNKVDHHRKVLKHLENIRLDIRIIDEKGGLSRLNRDNLSNLKHNLAQSQSAKGDSWSSRTFRSLNKDASNMEDGAPSTADADDDASDKPVFDAKNAAHILGVATF